MNLLIYNIKHAFQNLKNNAIYSILTIIGLTIGLTVFLLVVVFVFNEKTVDDNIANNNRIFRLINADQNNCGFGYELEDIIAKNYPDVKANCALERFEWSLVLRANNKNIKFLSGISTTNNFFKVFDIKIISKISQNPFADKASVILTKATAKKLFGETDPLGKTININNFFDAKVSAIIDAFPSNTSIAADYLINAEDKDMRLSTICDNGDCFNPMNQFILLKMHTDKDEFIDKFNTSISQFQTRVNSFAIQPLRDIYLSEDIDYNGNRIGNLSFIKIISLIGLVILILAIINYLNFSLSLQHTKIKEISIKKVVGADSMQLFFYYLAESMIVVAISLILSFVIIYTFSDVFTPVFGSKLNLQLIYKPIFITGIFAVLCIIIVVNSLIPAFSLLKLNVVNGLNNAVNKNSKNNLKVIFTTAQFTTSIILLIAVFFIHKQLSFIETKDLGFAKQNLLRIVIPYKFKKHNAFKQSIDKLSFVESSTFSRGCPGSINLIMGSGEKDGEFEIQCMMIDSNFLHTFKIAIEEGRNFLAGDLNKACMLNEAAIKKFGWTDLKNRKYKNGKDGGYNVVAGVNNFNVSSLYTKQEPVCLIYDNATDPNTLSVRIIPGHIVEQINQLKKIWESLADDPFEFQFYDEFFNIKYKKERQLSTSITLLATIAVMLTLIGILGQVIQTCNYRTKEIGIRKVVGASIPEIIRMLNFDIVKWLLLAFVMAVPIAYFSILNWLDNFAYRTPLSWWIFALSGVIILIVTVITVSWQTIMVARKNPVEALRYE